MFNCAGVGAVRAEEREECGWRGAGLGSGQGAVVHSTEMAGGRLGRDWLESVLTSYYLFIEQYQAAAPPGSPQIFMLFLLLDCYNFQLHGLHYYQAPF